MCLTCRARAWSVVMRDVARTWHGRSEKGGWVKQRCGKNGEVLSAVAGRRCSQISDGRHERGRSGARGHDNRAHAGTTAGHARTCAAGRGDAPGWQQRGLGRGGMRQADTAWGRLQWRREVAAAQAVITCIFNLNSYLI